MRTVFMSHTYWLIALPVFVFYLAYLSGKHKGQWGSNLFAALIKAAIWPLAVIWEVVVLLWYAGRAVGER